ncbi:MAG TPA: glycosyltransferase family 4 protein [Chitinophagales bacterium]|jgi:glycosyltransferase involved in cell wall biosynthesis|nr:glycosyltransferase family 4 protein [Chitinophagales bacterium]HPH87041.1 glycosyltransferase family 4 protein [Chitinophagales bacterium]
MKKILFLTPTLPYPPVSGGVIKSNKVVHFLSERYELTVACLLKNEDTQHRAAFQTTVQLVDFISEELNVPRTAKNLILSNLQGIPLNLFRNKSAAFKQKVNAIIHQYDVVFCDHYVMFQYIPENFKGKIVLHEHNCEYLIWKRYAGIEKSLPKKLALLNQASRIKKYERQICRKADVILAAPNDIEELVKIGADKQKFLETYHLGDDSLLEQENLQFQPDNNTLLYIGTLSWEANIDGLLWFYKDIFPLLKKKNPAIKLRIIGRHPDERLIRIAENDKDIILEGFVEELEPYFRNSNVFITPLRFGSGIKVKVVNSLYMGIPCVTTSIGAEGLKTEDGEHMFIKDSPQEFADAINLLLTNKTIWDKISNNAKALARKYYTWDYVLENIQKAVEK